MPQCNALIHTSYAFIVGRVVAGLGAAGLLQGALGIITYIAPLEKRQLYIGALAFSGLVPVEDRYYTCSLARLGYAPPVGGVCLPYASLDLD